MTERDCNALLVLVICGVLLAAFSEQFFDHKQACALCLLQRLGMLGVAFGALLNIKFGIRRSHYALSLISALFGASVALRQIALHVCPGFPVFGVPVWGLSLYTWSLIVFACSVAYIAMLMFVFSYFKEEKSSHISWLGRFAFYVVFFIAVTNIFTTLHECGLGDCEM